MNLEFPTHLPFPLYPTRPTEEDEAGANAFLEALRRLLSATSSSSTRPLAAISMPPVFYFDDSNQESTGRSRSAEVTQEAIAAVIKNITQPTKGEYVWDPAQNCWVLKLTPI